MLIIVIISGIKSENSYQRSEEQKVIEGAGGSEGITFIN